MSEQTTQAAQAAESNASATTAQTTTAQSESTPSATETADRDSLIAKAAEKASEVAQSRMEGTFKSMLKQSGLDTEAIAKITEEWKSKQRTPEQIEKEKDDEIARLSSELEQTKNERIAAGKGIPDVLIADYVRLAAGYDGKDFTEKLDAALAKFPLAKKETPPSYAVGTGTTPIHGTTDEILKRVEKYRRN